MIELDEQDPPRVVHARHRMEPAPGADRQRPERIERADRDPPPPLAVAVATDRDGPGSSGQPGHTPPPCAGPHSTRDSAPRSPPRAADRRPSSTPVRSPGAASAGRSGRAYSTRSPKYSRVHPSGVITTAAPARAASSAARPGSLEPARQREDAGRRVGRGEPRVVVIDRAQPSDRGPAEPPAGSGVVLVSGRRSADHHQRQSRVPRPRGSDRGRSSAARYGRRRARNRRRPARPESLRPSAPANRGDTPLGTTWMRSARAPK